MFWAAHLAPARHSPQVGARASTSRGIPWSALNRAWNSSASRRSTTVNPAGRVASEPRVTVAGVRPDGVSRMTRAAINPNVSRHAAANPIRSRGSWMHPPRSAARVATWAPRGKRLPHDVNLQRWRQPFSPPDGERSRDEHPLDGHRLVDRVVEFGGLADAGRGGDVHRLGHGGGVDGAVRVGGGGGADTELELLGGGGQAPGLVRAEAVLAGQHHGEPPPGAGLAKARLGHAEGDEPRDLVGPDGDGAEGGAARVDIALAEALHLDQPAPRRPGRDAVVAQRERRRRGGARRGGVVDVDVDQLRAERAAEGGAEVAGLQPEDDVGAVVEDLEALDVVGAGLEEGGGRVGVVARPVVVAVGVGGAGQNPPRRDGEDDRAW